jgi:hypothetical protein
LAAPRHKSSICCYDTGLVGCVWYLPALGRSYHCVLCSKRASEVRLAGNVVTLTVRTQRDDSRPLYHWSYRTGRHYNAYWQETVTLSTWVGGRAEWHILEVPGHAKHVCIDNLTAVAVGVLCAAVRQPGPLLDSFLAAGGTPAVVRLLRKSTCPGVLVYATFLITLMLNSPLHADGRPGLSSAELAVMLHEAGEGVE